VKLRRMLQLALVCVGVLVVGTSGGSAADTLTPANVELTIGAGGSTTVSQTLHLDASPPKADVILAIDTTGSMGAAVTDAKNDATSIVNQITSSIPGSRFAVVDFKDYPIGPLGGPGDYPYNLRAALTSNATTIQNAVNAIPGAGGGNDLPESYNRVIYESYSDSTLGRDAAAPGFLVILGDDIPHDAGQNSVFSSCPNTPPTDPGRDSILGNSDDLTTKGVLDGAVANHINVSYVNYNPRDPVRPCWSTLTSYTGGQRVEHSGTDSLASQIVSLINQNAAKIDQVNLTVTPASFSSWVSFTPPAPYGPFTAPIDKPYDMTVTVPSGTLPGDYVFSVHGVADGAVRADQSVTVHVVQQAISSVAITAAQTSRPPGIAAVPLGSIPASRIPAFGGGPASTAGGSIAGGSIAGGSIPGGSIAGGSIAGGSIAGGSIKLGDIGLGAIAGGSIAGGSIPGGSIAGGSIGVQEALQTVLLSQLPLTGPTADGATWDQVLAGTLLSGRALNTLTLWDVKLNTTAWDRLLALPLRDVPFATTLWGGVPIAAWLLGNATLGDLPVPGGYSSWGAALDASGGSSTNVTSHENTVTVFGVAVAGQLGSTDIGSLAGGSIAGGSIAGGSIPALQFLLKTASQDIVTPSRLAGIPLDTISPLADIVNCGTFVCTGKTLGQAAAVTGAIKSTATWGMLINDTPAGSPAKLMTLSELIFALLPSSQYPWENLNIQGLQDVAGTGQNVDYSIDFDVNCSLALAGFSIRAGLPSGEFPVAGSTKFSFAGGTPVAGADPAFNTDTGATWTTIPAGMCATTATRHVKLTFTAYERLVLGDHTATARVTANSATESANGAPVLVAQVQEPDFDAATAPMIQSNTLYVGHIASAGDIDARRFSLDGLAPGTKVAAFLKVPGDADFDLVLGKPESAGVRSSAGGSIAGGSIPIEDPGAVVDNRLSPLPPDTLSDVPQALAGGSIAGGSIAGGSIAGGSIAGGSIAGGSISANRNSATEVAQIVTNGETGAATLTVSGYNGSRSDQPYVLRIQVTPPPPLPNCPAVTGLSSATPGTLPSPSSLPSGTKTLFLVNRQRMIGLYGAIAVDALLSSPASPLAAVAGRAEVNGVVLPVDGDAGVRAAYGDWDSRPCEIPKVNGVVRKINDLVDTYRAARPDIKYIVLLGPDPAIPAWRQHDRVALSPEVDEAGELGFTTDGLTKGNPLYGAAAQNQVLTDGAYGVRKKLSWLGVDLPLPQDVVARFVESPDDIAGQLTQYNATGGILDPKSSLTTGDDFFADSSQAAHDALSAGFALTSADTLFPPGQVGWTKSDLLSRFFQNTTGVPDIGALYAHYNPWLAQPAGPITSLADLASTADVPTGTAMNGKILFTIGCHSGLNIPDFYDLTNDPVRSADWAQVYAKARAAVYIANSGYGYEDDISMALSGRLMALFAQKLNRGTGSIGEQWTDALDTYFRTAGDWDVLDEKVMLEATFYGPPWAHFAAAAGAPAPPPTPSPQPKDGLQIASLTVSPTIDENTTGDGRSWWDVDGQTLSVPYRSIQPLYTRDVTVPGMHAHDAFITSLAVQDFANKKPARAYPTVERSAYEPNANYKNIFWPAIPTTVLHSALGDTLNVVMGQFRPNSGNTELGSERLIQSIGVDIGYTTASDDIRPLIKQVGAVMTSGSAATVFVRATDESGPLNKVAVLYNDGVNNFKYQELSLVSGDLWTASVSGLAGPPEVIGEARDGSGNVGIAANKAVNYTAITDTANPSIVIDSPLAGGVFTLGQQVRARYACSDAGGVASCTGPVAVDNFIDTSSVGTKTFTVNATDLNGNTATKSVTYAVRFSFLGFLQPVDNLPTLNTAKPGSTIPLKWKLQNSSGVDTTSLEAVTSISSKEVKCPSATVDAIETTVPASLFPLKYDAVAKQYIYNWQTDKAWGGKCRRVFVAFSDGTYQAADFQFK
jgi:hypothetical protein